MNKPLPLSFKQKDDVFMLDQIARNEFAAVYEQSKAGNVWAYELVIPDSTHGKGGWVEQYPKSIEWGVRGWTIATRDEALRRLNLITKPLDS